MTDFLKQHDQSEAFYAAFPWFNSLPVEDRERIRQAWFRKDRITLVQEFGLDSDRSNDDSNSRVSPQ